MLAHRIATALVLLAIFVATLWSSSAWPFALLILVLVMAAAWEWGRLNGLSQPLSVALAMATGLLIMALLVMPAKWAQVHAALPSASTRWWWAAVLTLGATTWFVRAGVAGWKKVPQTPRLFIGVVWLAIIWFAIANVAATGINFMMSVLMLIWASDIAAYFGGRAWGGRWFGPRKLAPSISPGKTWEGAVSGLMGALTLAVVWIVFVDPKVPNDGPGLYTRIVESHGWLAMTLAVAVLVAAGILGDLFESLVKRAAGAKDSSQLLPGHGGVLDRVDALLPVLPLAVALSL